MEPRLRKDGKPDGRQDKRYPSPEFDRKHFQKGDCENDLSRGTIFYEMNKVSENKFSVFLANEYKDGKGCKGNKFPRAGIEDFIVAGYMAEDCLDPLLRTARNLYKNVDSVKTIIDEHPDLKPVILDYFLGKQTRRKGMKDWDRLSDMFWGIKNRPDAYEHLHLVKLGKEESGCDLFPMPSVHRRLDYDAGVRVELSPDSNQFRLCPDKQTRDELDHLWDWRPVPESARSRLREVVNNHPELVKDNIMNRKVPRKKRQRKDLTTSENLEILGMAATTA